MGRIISLDEFQTKLDWYKKHHVRVVRQSPGQTVYRRGKKTKEKTTTIETVCIDEKDTYMQLVVKEPGRTNAVTYKAYLDGENDHVDLESYTATASAEFFRYYKPEETDLIKDVIKKGYTSRAILGNNKKYDRTRNYAYEYDVNSAYSAELLNDIPNTSKNYGPKVVEDDEYGYNVIAIDGEIGKFIVNVPVGKKALYVFKKMPSPYGPYVEKYYKIKKTTTGTDKAIAKSKLNVVIGNLQNHDPFVRAQIVNAANKRIEDLIDENTLYWNTDSIVSLVRRPDIEANLGPDIGQWKLDKEGLFAYVRFNYQWNDEIPGWRGRPKTWFKGRKIDILVDSAPPKCNKYKFDWTEGKIVENEQYFFGE